MSIWWDKYKFLIILVVFACFTYLLSDNQTANEEGKVLDDEMFAEIIVGWSTTILRLAVQVSSIQFEYIKL
jgi:hypothetical protein